MVFAVVPFWVFAAGARLTGGGIATGFAGPSQLRGRIHFYNLKYPRLGLCSQFFADQFALISETCRVSAWRDCAEWLCEL